MNVIPWQVKAIGAAVAAAVLLSAGGYATHEWDRAQEAKRMETCAEGIRTSKIDKCPQRIIDAFATIQLQGSEATVEYRDRSIPVIVENQAAVAALQGQLNDALAELASKDKTNACATSPAFATRRLQLCRMYGGKDCPVEPGPGQTD